MTGETVYGLRERALRMRNALALELPAPVWVDVADIVDGVLTRLDAAEADAEVGWRWAWIFDEMTGHGCSAQLSDAEKDQFRTDLQRHENYGDPL